MPSSAVQQHSACRIEGQRARLSALLSYLLMKADLPATPRGLFATWKEIIDILEKRKNGKTYQYEAVIP